MRHALAHRIAAELGEDVRHGHVVSFAGLFYITYDLVDHELVIIFKAKGVLDGEPTADIDGIQLGADLFELTVQVDDLVQLAPIVDIVLDALIEKDVQHLQLEAVFVPLDLVHIELEYIPGPESKPGGVKREGRLFFCRHPDAQFERDFHGAFVLLQFVLIVQNGDDVPETAIQQGSDAAGIGFLFEPVADDKSILRDLLALVQLLDDIDIVGIGSFQVDIVLERLFDDKGEVGALGTITLKVFALIAMLLDRRGKHLFRFVDLHVDLRQVGELHRRTILVDQRFYIEAIKLKIVVLYFETLLREVKGLRHQVGVRIVH